MIARLKLWIHAGLIALDQLAYVLLVGPWYVIGLAACPSPYETISSFTGRRANAGQRWAIVAQVAIDRLFEALGSPPGHCQRSIVRADLQLPLPY